MKYSSDPFARGRFASIAAMLIALILMGASLHGQGVYISEGDSEINCFNTSHGAGEYSELLPSNDSADAMTFDSSGNMYVVSGTGGGEAQIDEISPGGNISVYATLPSGSGLDGCLAFDSYGDLFEVAGWTGQVFEISPAGAVSTFLTLPGGDSSGYFGIAIDKNNDLFVSNFGNDTISEITPGGSLSTFATLSTEPTGLAFNSSGDLFTVGIGAGELGQISEISESGSASTFATLPANSQPEDLAFDSAGNLYVPDHQAITEFNSSGTVVKTTSYYWYYSPYIAVSPVPEPSTWGMLAAGGVVFAFRMAAFIGRAGRRRPVREVGSCLIPS